MSYRIHLFAFTTLIGSLLAFGWCLYEEQVRQDALTTTATALGHRLSAYGQQLEHTSDAMGQHIGYHVYQNRYQARDKVVQQQAEQIIARADAMADSLGGLILFMTLTDAAKTKQFSFHFADDFPAGLNTPGLEQLARHLDRYVAFIRQYVPDARSLTHPTEPFSTSTNFSAYYFQCASEASAVATLERLIAQVRRYEADALSIQTQKVGGYSFGFDRIGAAAIPTSGTVAPGALYEAQLLLAESFSGFYYKQMSWNGHKIRRFENDQELVEIPIPTSTGSCPDTIRAEWQGRIQTRLYPADTTWQLTVPFLVLNKPTP